MLAWLWKVHNLCFVSVTYMVSVRRTFVYNTVDITKIAIAFLAKPPPYM